jgi:hypothetical protein
LGSRRTGARTSPRASGKPSLLGRLSRPSSCFHSAKDSLMLKLLGWIILTIFLIGLLVVIGVFDFIF